uniref:Fatty acid hydroxylase domain-containing protein n=1 Tax=Tetraselmis chuii TaxID=63592 RepID=A0A7S1SZN5_9CHLO|mmetsp:Transcript_36316/g.64976  ORF Transcript_36316/g.64976 Transcript_36316/m.64976 type:complete len:268 (+) Transcript_36316:50-853(+)
MFGDVLPVFGGGFLVAFRQLSLFYYGVCFALHTLVPWLTQPRPLQQQPRKRNDVMRDAFYSIGPLAVKAGYWKLIEELHAHDYGLMYDTEVRTVPQILYAILTIVTLDYLHDAWFYWTHRLLHWRPLYKHVHYMHHQSTVPSAYTGYSFHLLEAALVFANEVILIFLFPIHTKLHRLYHIFTTAIHNGGHAGYELAPFIPSLEQLAWLILNGTGKQCKGLNTVMHHDMHHRYPTKHFSLYFTHWDRWCKTLHESYDALVDARKKQNS